MNYTYFMPLFSLYVTSTNWSLRLLWTRWDDLFLTVYLELCVVDNTISDYGWVNFIKNWRKSGWVTFELYMIKAYDQIEWNCLKYTMLKLAFAMDWVNLIKLCMTTITYSFNFNVEHVGYITPTRCLSQGLSSPFVLLS